MLGLRLRLLFGHEMALRPRGQEAFEVTSYTARDYADNLREKNKKLKDQLEAVRKWHEAQVGRQVDPTDIKELGEILEKPK